MQRCLGYETLSAAGTLVRWRRSPNVPGMTVIVGTGPVSFADVVAVARGGAAVELADDAVAAIEASRIHIEALAANPSPVYGVSTGFGALATRPSAGKCESSCNAA